MSKKPDTKDAKDTKDKDKTPVQPPCDTRNYARYYDSPDGCDLPTKIKVATRYGVVAGLIAGTYDVMMYSHVVGMGPILRRYARHAVPLGLMGATFATVSTLTLRARCIDDKLNYFLGGLACGPILALYLRSGHGVVAGGVFLGAIGVIKKEAIETNYALLHVAPTDHMNTITGHRSDYSLAADPRDAMIHTCDDDFDDEKTKRKKKQAQRRKEQMDRLKSGEPCK